METAGIKAKHGISYIWNSTDRNEPKVFLKAIAIYAWVTLSRPQGTDTCPRSGDIIFQLGNAQMRKAHKAQ